MHLRLCWALHSKRDSIQLGPPQLKREYEVSLCHQASVAKGNEIDAVGCVKACMTPHYGSGMGAGMDWGYGGGPENIASSCMLTRLLLPASL